AGFYAVDLFAAYTLHWGGIYESGGLILADRYTTSNAVHQGSKLPREELAAFFDWLYDFEYIRLELPRPDMVIYLDVDIDTSLSRIRRRAAVQGERPDIHEQDEHYLRQCLATGKLAADHYGWQVIAWEENGRERAAEEKSREIFSLIKKQGLI
ncbi:MAG: deoxynucleoside kinase, partial [Oscillospiraceae bacterium]|nr:deoxynucleoside kinase [Oscillospiraceae bacterium]